MSYSVQGPALYFITLLRLTSSVIISFHRIVWSGDRDEGERRSARFLWVWLDGIYQCTDSFRLVVLELRSWIDSTSEVCSINS